MSIVYHEHHLTIQNLIYSSKQITDNSLGRSCVPLRQEIRLFMSPPICYTVARCVSIKISLMPLGGGGGTLLDVSNAAIQPC